MANFGSDGHCKVYWTSEHEVYAVNLKDNVYFGYLA